MCYHFLGKEWHLKTTRLLLEAGADPNPTGNDDYQHDMTQDGILRGFFALRHIQMYFAKTIFKRLFMYNPLVNYVWQIGQF